MLMAYAINIDDAWGIVNVWNYQSLEEARTVFADRCDDLWCKIDGTIKAVVLVQGTDAGAGKGVGVVCLQVVLISLGTLRRKSTLFGGALIESLGGRFRWGDVQNWRDQRLL